MTKSLFVRVAAVVGMMAIGSGGAAGCSSSSSPAPGSNAGDGGLTGVTDGASSGNPTSSCGGDAGANNCPAYVSCAESKCSTQSQACFGADGKSGVCSGYTACAQNCNCDANCLVACQRTSDCDACIKTYSNCVTGSCGTELSQCAAATFDGGGFDGSIDFSSHTCKDLAACCATSSQADSCNQVVGLGYDAACSAAFSSFGCK